MNGNIPVAESVAGYNRRCYMKAEFPHDSEYPKRHPLQHRRQVRSKPEIPTPLGGHPHHGRARHDESKQGLPKPRRLVDEGLGGVQEEDSDEGADRQVVDLRVGDVVGGVEPDEARVDVLDAVGVGEQRVRRRCRRTTERLQGRAGADPVADYRVDCCREARLRRVVG